MQFERWRVHRRLRRIPELSSSTVPGAVARVTGVVRVARAPLIAPRSERACVVWRIRFVVGDGGEYSTVASSGGRYEAFELSPFVIERDPERVVIDGARSLFDVPAVHSMPEGTGQSWRRFCEQRLLTQRDDVRDIEEVIVEPGALVSVAGVLLRDPVPRLTGTFDQPLLIGRAPAGSPPTT